VLADGHIDISSTLDTDRLLQTIHDGSVSPAVDREIDAVTLHVRAAAERRSPQDPAYAFLGAPGAPVWLLPESQDEGLLWPGWSLRSGTRPLSDANEVRWHLGAVRGPGRFVLYQNDSFGRPLPRLSSEPGQDKTFAFHEHGHGTWAFTADGAYCLPITATETVSGHVATFTLLVAVGQVDAGSVTPTDCGKTAHEINTGAPAPEPTPTPSPEPIPTASPTPKPQPDVRPRAKAPSISARTKTQRLDRRRAARLATLICPSGGGPCRVTAPRTVPVTISGTAYRVRVHTPRSIRAGARASLRISVPAAAAARLAGRRAKVRIRVQLSTTGTTARTTRTVTATITQRRTP
jgi:surface-anchored protein